MLARDSLEIVTLSDPERWRETLEETGGGQLYHLPEFHRLAELEGQGQAVMPVYKNGRHTITLPILLRSIPLTAASSKGLIDATSVGGFVGPLTSPDVPEDVIKCFQQSLQNYFEQNRIVSVYNRLHPMINQRPLLEGYGELAEVGVTLSIDLTIPSEERIRRYRKGHRASLKKLKKNGFICEEVRPEEHMDEFLPVYYDTMDRVHAGKAYYFDRYHVDYMMREMADIVHLWVCKKDGLIVSGNFCVLYNSVVEGHMSGTASNYMQYAPSVMVFDAMCAWGHTEGAYAHHLGGGVGAQRDSLYDFKTGFAPVEHTYFTWRRIVNQEIYCEVCREAYRQAGCVPDTPYFPMYRHPSLQPVTQQREEVEGIKL